MYVGSLCILLNKGVSHAEPLPNEGIFWVLMCKRPQIFYPPTFPSGDFYKFAESFQVSYLFDVSSKTRGKELFSELDLYLFFVEENRMEHGKPVIFLVPTRFR